MFRKIIVLLICLLWIPCLALPVFAEIPSFIVDEAGLLLPEEITLLEEKADELMNAYGIYAAVLTVDSLNASSPQNYADDYYDRTDYGDDGVLFLLAMSERDWYISTSGTVRYALTDYGVQQIGEAVVPFLTDGLWFDGFCCFLDSLPVYLDALENSAPIDGYADFYSDYYHGDQEEIIYYEEESSPNFLLSFLCGIVISGIVLIIMRLSMNTKRPQRGASVYMEEGSWNLSQRRDLFLYSNVTKVRKQEPPKHTGGGSSVHRSSSGRSHGGGGGKF